MVAVLKISQSLIIAKGFCSLVDILDKVNRQLSKRGEIFTVFKTFTGLTS